jgi:CheY-like chemotaxis protein
MSVRMLIADDSPDHLWLLGLMLERLADVVVVATAANGAEAVRLAAENDVDVALLDVDMPTLGGFAAAEAIRRLKPETTILLQTGHIGDETRRRADELGLFVFEKFDLVKNLDLLTRFNTERRAA